MKLEQKKELYFEGAKKIIPQIEMSQMFFLVIRKILKT